MKNNSRVFGICESSHYLTSIIVVVISTFRSNLNNALRHCFNV